MAKAVDTDRIYHNEITKEGNTLQAVFYIDYENEDAYSEKITEKYFIGELAMFQVRFNVIRTRSYNQNYKSYADFKRYVLIRFVKLQNDDDLSYTIKFSSNVLDVADKMFLTDDTWHLIKETTTESIIKSFQEMIDFSIVMDIFMGPSSFSPLYEDTDFTDFHLQGVDGSVPVHKQILAAASPVLRTMLSGKWKETESGNVEVAGTSKETLEHLKDFLYLHKLPDEGLDHLLVLAAYYIMSDLVQACSAKLLFKLTNENAYDLLSIACKYKLKKLFFGILESVKRGEVVKTKEMRELCLPDDWM